MNTKYMFRVSVYHFLAVWELADCVETVAFHLCRPASWVRKTARRVRRMLRRDDVELKRLPLRAGLRPAFNPSSN